MTTTRPIPPLTALTESEARIIDAWLETGSIRRAAQITGKHRNTVAGVLDRYRDALRVAVKEFSSKDCANGTVSGE